LNPMDTAWRVLKVLPLENRRQMGLDEWIEDAPSEQGAVIGYRGVRDPEHLKDRQGVAARPVFYEEGKPRFAAQYPHVDELPNEAVWAFIGHDEEGLETAKRRATSFAGKKGSVVGIRGPVDLSYPDKGMMEHLNRRRQWRGQEPHGGKWSAYAIPHDIPAKQIVNLTNGGE